MDWSLYDLAKDSHDVALGLHTFVDQIPEHANTILGYTSSLSAISPELRRLERALDSHPFRRTAAYVTADIDVLASSLQLTLEAIRKFFARSANRTRRAWSELCGRFEAEGFPLEDRLIEYQLYTQGIYDFLRGDSGEEELDDVSSLVKRLRARQHGNAAPRPRMPSRPNFARNPHYVPRPQEDPSYDYDVDYGDYGDFGDVEFFYPPAPEVSSPLSPTFSHSSWGTYHSSETSPTRENGPFSPSTHWAFRIFDGRHPWTQFSGPLGQPTRCLGRDMPSAVDRLHNERFQKVVEIPFDGDEVIIRLYWRPSDHRARILFLTMDPLNRRHRYTIPLTALRIIRTGSCLQLCRVNRQDGQLDLWANLRFQGYERMVLFYCTAVALKRQDSIETAPNMEDFFQPGEEIEFSAEIEDDRYRHAFRVFRDRNSGAVRFEATAMRGPMKKTPIWTAFVTQYVGSRTWMRRLGPRVVSLSEFHPYVFCDGYTPPRGITGQFELRFSLSDDCKNFVEVFHSIPAGR